MGMINEDIKLRSVNMYRGQAYIYEQEHKLNPIGLAHPLTPITPAKPTSNASIVWYGHNITPPPRKRCPQRW